MVLPTLLYAHETGTVYQRHAKKLNHFHTSCLRKLLKIKWQDKIPDTEVLKRAGMQSVHTLLKLAQLRWTCHVTRMPDERLPNKSSMENYKLENAPMVVRRSDKKDTLKISLKDFNIPTESWEQIAQDRTKWRGLIRKGAGEYEAKESAKPSRNVHSGKPELSHHQQSPLPQTSLVLSATGSLELRLVLSAILEHINNNT